MTVHILTKPVQEIYTLSTIKIIFIHISLPYPVTHLYSWLPPRLFQPFPSLNGIIYVPLHAFTTPILILPSESTGKLTSKYRLYFTVANHILSDKNHNTYNRPFIYDIHQKIRFLTPSPCPHASTWTGPPPPCGRQHAVDMKCTPLSLNG